MSRPTRQLSGLAWFSAALAVVAGCSGDAKVPAPDGGAVGDLQVLGDQGAHGDASGDGGQLQGIAAPPPGEGVQIEFTTTVGPGTEIELCKFWQAPAEGLAVRRSETWYNASSHHLLVYTTGYQQIPTTTRYGKQVDTSRVFSCNRGPFLDWNLTGIIAAAQSPTADDSFELPPGVAVTLPANAVLLVNLHIVNASNEKVNPRALTNLWTIPKDSLQTEAGLLFFYNHFISVPPKGEASARISCPISEEITLVSAQSHMHARGVGYQAKLVDKDGLAVETLYETDSWDDVPVKAWKPGKTIAAGSSIDYRCDYKNYEDRQVLQGFTSDDEMCMFVGAYYPRNGALELCAVKDDVNASGTAATFIGSGTVDCATSLQCLASASTLDAMQPCIVNSCPAIAVPMTKAYRCFLAGGNMTTCADDINACVATPCR